MGAAHFFWKKKHLENTFKAMDVSFFPNEA